MPLSLKKTFRKFLINEYFLIHLALIMGAGVVTPMYLHPKLTPINPFSIVPLTIVLVYEAFLFAAILRFLKKAPKGKQRNVMLLALLLPVLMAVNICWGAKGAYLRVFHSGFHEVEDWRAAAEQGDGLAQYKLGMHSALNMHDMDEAARWCFEAAAHGHDCDKLLGEEQQKELHEKQKKFKK